MGFKKIEKETIISFNEKEESADLETYNKKIIRKLDGLCMLYADLFTCDASDSNGCKNYTIPKVCISINKPRNRRKLSEEEKERRRMRLKKNRNNAIKNKKKVS